MCHSGRGKEKRVFKNPGWEGHRDVLTLEEQKHSISASLSMLCKTCKEHMHKLLLILHHAHNAPFFVQ